MKRVQIERYPHLDYATTEALNTLGTNVVFSGDSVKRILITSCREHEGKSFVSISLMRTLASMGYSVALVDADLRRSVLAGKYGITFPADALGLSHYLSRNYALEDVVYATDIRRTYIVPVGHDVVNSMQLLNSWRFEELLQKLAEKVDYVIVDTPPVNAIVDAAVAARVCDAAILVATAGLASKQEVLTAKQQIEKSGCPMIGAVLNKVEMDRHSSKYYHRSYYASHEKSYYRRTDEENQKSKGKKRSKRAV